MGAAPFNIERGALKPSYRQGLGSMRSPEKKLSTLQYVDFDKNRYVFKLKSLRVTPKIKGIFWASNRQIYIECYQIYTECYQDMKSQD